jgi:hypothetical protein
MSEWQPAIILDVHTGIGPDIIWPFIGKKVRVQESKDPKIAKMIAEMCDAERFFLINEDDAKALGCHRRSFVCEHEILTD